ncbi:MAG: amino acid permease [Chitinophagaceae bacterium]|nr:amino acid permease [Chitinophagaceae bacterium]
MSLFVRKPLDKLLAEAKETGEHTLKRTLGSGALLALGIGAIIGAGIFVRTAAAAGNHAGPAVMISYIIAGIGCAFAGLCYVEFASMIPIAGSAYTYSYATMGELIAWIIGWDLILEYALGAATVAIAWSEYLNKLCETYFGFTIPYEWCHSPFQSDLVTGVHGIINVPALLILGLLTLLLIRGTKESANFNSIIVIVKVFIVLVFIFLGWQFIVPANHAVIIPPNTGESGAFGWSGVLRGAGIVFFAYVGFDAVSTAAQEAKNPQKGMPIGILGSLAFCTVLYILFSYVLTGIAHYSEFSVTGPGHEAAVAYAISKYLVGYEWFSGLITIAILAGFSSVILVMLMGQSRVFFSMSKDGLFPKSFSEVHKKYNTPAKATMWLFILVGAFAAFVPGDVVGDMCSIGTLFAFILVSAGVIVMRKTNPDAVRPFRVALVPLVPILGILVCGFMVFGLGFENWSRLLIWLIIGFDIYLLYSLKNSILADKNTEAQKSKIVTLVGLITTSLLLLLTYLVYFNPGHLISANFETKELDTFFKFIVIFSIGHILIYGYNFITKLKK